jgi:RNA polymerase sigma-70 factor (ECF subfamily)
MTEQAQSTASRDGPEPDSLWIQQIAAGDRDAFEKLYKAYAARLFRYLFSMIGDSSAAEELTNDVMVAAWKSAAKFRGESKPSTWLFGIAHHKALNELRRKPPLTVEIENASELATPGEGPEGAVRRASLEQTVRGALQELSPEHREVVELTFYQGLSYQEIAEIMQSPVNTVKTRMFYAKKRLQEVLERQGIVGETL